MDVTYLDIVISFARLDESIHHHIFNLFLL